MSRIGNKWITLSEKVKVTVDAGGQVVVEGPKGKLEWHLPEGITLTVEDAVVRLERKNESRKYRAMHGLARALVNNMVEGVSNGFKKELEIQGVGFKAAVQGKVLNLSLGYSHPVLFEIPEEVKITVADNTKVTIEGIDKHRVGQCAADIRGFHPPEPYKGKGIRYSDEYVRRKEGKTVQ